MSGLSLPNGNPQVSSTVTSVQPQMQRSVIQTVPTPNLIQNQNVSNNPGGPSATPNTLSVLEQGKTEILEPDSFDGSEKGPEISEYFIHFEQIALLNRWGPDQKARILTIK